MSVLAYKLENLLDCSKNSFGIIFNNIEVVKDLFQEFYMELKEVNQGRG